MFLKYVPCIPATAGLILTALTLTAPQKCPASAMVPDVDRVILTIGQNVESVQGYDTALSAVPGGIMSYSSTAGVEGLFSTVNYGSGNIDAGIFVNNPVYTNTVLQLGIYINGDMGNILAGVRDGNIASIGNWIKSAGCPVYLRIGYEFDGPWNALDPNQFVQAYQYIVDKMRANNVTNVAYVWHSCAAPTYNGYPISAWYPGDNYVDWVAISVYQQFAGTLGTVADLDNVCNFAKTKNKPIMIAESTAYGGISDARWANWFLPCLDLIHRHHIQMWSYIDANWEAQPMFAGQGWGDCRVETDPYIMSNWQAMVSSPMFLQQSSELYPRLHANATNGCQEAESAQINGAYTYADSEASGGMAVTGLSSPGRSVTFTSTGTAQQFVLRYSSPSYGTIGLYVNSQPRRTLQVSATGGAYQDLLVHQQIPAGASVRIQFDYGDVSPNLDSILFRGYADSDNDGLPDDWEMWRFGSLQYGPNDDPDHDGNSNYTEWVADTDPMNSASCLRIKSVVGNTSAPVLNVSACPSRTYYVEQSTDMKNWSIVSSSQTNSAAAYSAVVVQPPPKAFYRVVIP